MEISLTSTPEVLKLIAHEVRWNLVRSLTCSDYRVTELVRFLALPQNLVSYHLRLLSKAKLVTERKSDADERSTYYSLDLPRLLSLYLEAADRLHPIVGDHLVRMDRETWQLPTPPLRVLFLCTENSARSQMAEALLRHLSHGTVETYSAGSRPAERVHPLAVQVLQAQGIEMSHAVPKPVALFQQQPFDAIVTVCDRVREVCPTFPDDELRMHWSLADPAALDGTEEEQRHAFEWTAEHLSVRLRFLLAHLERASQHERGWLG